MNDKPCRRWGTFSLRTMFVVTTLFCCWLGWEMSVVRIRQGKLAELRTKPGVQVCTATEWQAIYPDQPAARIFVVRNWLGDQAIQEIAYTPQLAEFPELEVERLARIFSEAKLRRQELPLEPCHPGCFPRGTLVESPSGPRTVDGIETGESILAFLPSGESQVIQIQAVFVTDNRIWKVETEAGSLFTTQTQPLCLADGQTVQAGKLQAGDQILRRMGDEIHATKVLSITPTDRIEKVFNLILGNSEIFVANGFLARSKPPKAIAAQ